MALQFTPASSDNVNCGTLSSQDPSAITICMWCRSTSGTNQETRVPFSKLSGSFTRILSQYRGTSTSAANDLRIIWGRSVTSTLYETNDAPVARDQWNFIAISGNQSGSANDLHRIYVGDLSTLAVASSLGITNDGSGTFGSVSEVDFILHNHPTDAKAPDGDCASACVINEELSLPQIHLIQHRMSNALLFDCFGYWELGLTADASSSQPDYSGKAHTGTPSGVAQVAHVPLVAFPSSLAVLVPPSGVASTVINCTLGTIEVAGLVATVGAGTQVNASPGAVEVAGLAAGVGAGTQVNASPGAIDVAGLPVGVGAGIQVNASLGAIDVAGLVVTLPTGAVVDCGLGAIEVAGLPAGVGAGIQVNAAIGAIEVAGLSVGVGAGTQVNAAIGAIEVAGLAASISAGRDIAVSLGTIEVAGHAVSGSSGQTLLLNTGQFTVAGLPVSISAGTVLAVGLGAVQVAGLAATITNPQTVTASLGAVEVAGLPVAISAGTVLAVGVGAIDVLGLPVAISAGTQVNASLGLVDVLGLPATVMTPSGPIGVTLGVIEISGHNVVIAISIGHTLGPESGVIETGPESGFIETGPELGLIKYNDVGVIE